MNEQPLAVSSLEAVSLADQHDLAIATLEHHLHLLNGADDTHVAINNGLDLKDVDFAGLESAEHPIKHLQCRLDPLRGKRRDVKPKRVLCPVPGALCSRHRFTHLLDDGE